MPTAGEANIRPTNHYNLRNKPLPKTKSFIKKKASEKENIPEKPAPNGPVTRSRSKIPVSTNQPPKTNKGRDQKPKRKGVPDFAKLHKDWQNKFEKGKAVKKKACTQVQEFDLTRPGTRFKQTYYNGQTEDNGEGFREDHEALESILNDEGISENATRGHRNTIASTGTNHAAPTSTRKTLGSIPVSKSYQPNNANNANNMAHSTTKVPTKQVDGTLKKPRKSLAQQQKDMGIEFEEDLGALASILNNTGLSHTKAAPTYRQTFASSRGVGGARASLFGGQPQTQKRTSIYYQPQASTKDAYDDYTRLVMRRLTTGDNAKSVPQNRSSVLHPPTSSVRTSIYHKSLPAGIQQHHNTKTKPIPTSTTKSTPGRVHVTQPSKPYGSARKTPMTASRVPNPHFHSVLQKQEITSSPLLSGSRQMPESHLQTPSTQKKVQWAEDIVAIPSAEELATSLFTDQTEPIAKVEDRIMQQMEQFQEMEKLEKQLELEIQMLSDIGDLGESKMSGKGAALDVHHRKGLVRRQGEDKDQPSNFTTTPRHHLSDDVVASSKGLSVVVNPLQSHSSVGVPSYPPQIAWDQPPVENIKHYQLPSTVGMSSGGCGTYNSTAGHQNTILGYPKTLDGLRNLQESCVLGKTGLVGDGPLQHDMLASRGAQVHMNTQCSNLVCSNPVVSQSMILQGGVGVTSIRHHHPTQSVPSSQGCNGYAAGDCPGQVIHSSENVSSQRTCSECNMTKGSQLQENLMVTQSVSALHRDGLGSITRQVVGSSVGHPGAGVDSQPLINCNNSFQQCLHGNMLVDHHCTKISGMAFQQKSGCTCTPCIHNHQLVTTEMSTKNGDPASQGVLFQRSNTFVHHSKPSDLERNGIICSPASVLVPSRKVSKVAKTVTFASPHAIESREGRVCSFRTTPYPGMPQRGVIQEDCMDGIKGRLEFGTECSNNRQNLFTDAAVSNTVLTSSPVNTTVSVIKNSHVEPVMSTKVKGCEPNILQLEMRNSLERTSQAACSGTVETLSLRGHLPPSQNNRRTVTEFKGRAGIIFQEALLDQECALYAHSLQRKISPGSSAGRDDFNPVAKIFLEKDDAHFCPVLEQSFS